MRSLSRITYVEDDADIGAIARMALEEIGGFEVQICSSGAKAVEQTPGFKPDLILLDVMMPVMDGPATFRSLTAIPELTDTPVVFMTATARADEVEKYLALGAVGFIAKPFNPVELANEVTAIWESAYEAAAS